MNYALDALQQKLTTPSVHDLTSLLTTPPLWQSGCKLSVYELLGKQGFRYLLALDVDPAPLTEHLTQRVPFGYRLGIYIGELPAFWFAYAPHAKLRARSLSVLSDSQTLGAADLVASLNRQVYHIELACKYYGGSQVQDLCGLNPRDMLTGRTAKLVQQLDLLYTPQGREALTTQALSDSPVSVSVARDTGFFPYGFDAFESLLDPYGWRGVYIRNWTEYRFERIKARYHLLDRMAYLAPARVAKTDTLNKTEIRRIGNGLIAILELCLDGFRHEAEHTMKAV